MTDIILLIAKTIFVGASAMHVIIFLRDLADWHGGACRGVSDDWLPRATLKPTIVFAITWLLFNLEI